jgi:hypothetical protein
MLQLTLARGTRLAHNHRLINRRKLRGKARARAIARVNAKRLGRQPRAHDKPKDYPLADDSFWATDQDEDNPELQGPSIAHPPRTARRLVSRHLLHHRSRRAGARATPTAHDDA